MAKQMEEVQAFSVRLPKEEHQALRVYAAVTGESMNEIVTRAIRDFLADAGRRDQVRALFDDTVTKYQVALDKLADL